MLYKIVFVCLAGLVLVKLVKMDPMEITFNIGLNNDNLTCDHNVTDSLRKKYTVFEGNRFKIFINYKTFINHFICRDYYDDKQTFGYQDTLNKHNTTVEKRMGTLWNCTILIHKNITTKIKPSIVYKDSRYAAAYCYMNIHVRQTESPQTILVNNVVLKPIRNNLPEQDIDFTVDYQYAEDELVNVTCANFLNSGLLTMKYAMVDSMSDKFTSAHLSSSKGIGFIMKLHSGHNNTHALCTNTEFHDYTKVMVTFIMQTQFNNFAKIRINGMIVRQKYKHPINNFYSIEYRYISNELITVICEVPSDMILSVGEYAIKGTVSNYNKKELIPNVKTEMSFCPKHNNTSFRCSVDNIQRASVEITEILLTDGDKLLDRFSLHMDLPSKGIVMELYENAKLRVIYYEFEDDETFEFKCYPLFSLTSPPVPGPVMYLQYNDSSEYKKDGSAISKTLQLTSKYKNTVVTCFLKAQKYNKPSDIDEVLREIRVIFIKTVPVTTEVPISTVTTAGVTDSPLPDNVPSDTQGTEPPFTIPIEITAAIGGATCIVLICVSTIIVKLRKRNHLQRGPYDRHYENLQTPSEVSIPSSPPQWESNYAVPVDGRADDTTYSVPCQPETNLYAIPVPKRQRNKKKQVEPSYAILDVKNAIAKRNVLKNTNDPNYSEIYAKGNEQCYAKVIPKSLRNKIEDNAANVKNESPYANTADPEPMYCEPNIAPKPHSHHYANLNNARYANSPAQEYVEPTYCEVQRQNK